LLPQGSGRQPALSAASSWGQQGMTGMTDAATTCLRAAADSLALARFLPSEADLACEFAAMAMADLPAELATQVERALACGNYRALDELAIALEPPPAAPPPNPAPPTRDRPTPAHISGASLLCHLEIIEPWIRLGGFGVTLHFGKDEAAPAQDEHPQDGRGGRAEWQERDERYDARSRWSSPNV
jgi:hypothetical protein